jgi:hypothetical protein
MIIDDALGGLYSAETSHACKSCPAIRELFKTAGQGIWWDTLQRLHGVKGR